MFQKNDKYFSEESNPIPKGKSESLVEQLNLYEAKVNISDDLSIRKKKGAGLALIQPNSESSKDLKSMRSPILTPFRLLQRREIALSLASPNGALSSKFIFNFSGIKLLLTNISYPHLLFISREAKKHSSFFKYSVIPAPFHQF